MIADIRMGGMSGLELQQALRSRGADLPVVIVTAHGDVAAARQAFLANAVDFIEKPFEPQQIVAAIAQARARRGAAPAASKTRPAATPRVAAAQLSERELEVLQLLVQGLHNRRIAADLGISHRTVEIHKARVLEKMGATNLVELVRLVQQPEAD